MPTSTPGSLRCNGNIYLQTGSNTLLTQRSSASVSFLIKYNSSSFPTKSNFQGYLLQFQYEIGLHVGAFGTPSSMGYTLSSTTSGNNGVQGESTFLDGSTYHVALTWSPTQQVVWINGQIAATSAYVNNLTGSTQSRELQLGWLPGNTSTIDYELGQLAIWDNYALTEADVLSLRDQTIAPTAIGGGATAYWPFEGTLAAPVALGDPGLQDIVSSNNFIQFYNSSNVATTNDGTLTYGPPLVYVDPTSVIPYVAKSGAVVYFFAVSTGDFQIPAYPTLVSANPTIYVNGAAVSAVGPFWSMVSREWPFVAYQLPNPVSASDALSYTSPAGWLTSTLGDAVPVVSPAPIANYTGILEPGYLGQPPFGLPPKQTLQLGFNIDWPPSQDGSSYSPTKNWLKRSFWNGLLMTDSNGRPITISGSATATIVAMSDVSWIDSKYTPNVTGTWTFVADESDPVHPMTVTMSTSDYNQLLVTAISMKPGIVNGAGVEVGKTWTWSVEYPANPTNWSQGLQITVEAAGGANPGNWTLSNEFLFAPTAVGTAPALTRTNPLAIEPNLQNTVTTPSGRTPYVLRFPDSTLTYDGISSVIDATDMLNVSAFTWASLPSSSTTVIQIRPYSVTAVSGTPGSPFVYTNQWGTPTAPGLPGPYVISPTSIDYLNFSSYETQWYVAEAVTSAPHGFKTGQIVNFNSPPSITLTNGSGTIQTPSSQPFGAPALLWVTGADSFAFTQYGGFFTKYSGLGLPGNINNVAASQSGVPVSFTASINVPDWNTIPYECAAAVAGSMPNTNLWVNVPVAATNACAVVIAEHVRDSCTRGRKVYVEYSNEVWSPVAQKFYVDGLSQLGFLDPGGPITAYAVRASQIHNIFINTFNQQDANGAVNRGAEIVCLLGSQFAGTNITAPLMTFIKTYNQANPTAPIRVDAVAIAPYADMNGDQWSSPTIPATVNPTGGGTTGGLLAAGTYYLAYTWIDPVTGMESAAGGESAQFTVAAGDVPTAVISFPAASGLMQIWTSASVAIPNWSQKANIYLTPANGASGSEVLYMAGVVAAGNTLTVNLATAAAGSVAPPPQSRVPSVVSAAASIWSANPLSVAHGAATPSWTREMFLELFRHHLHYSAAWAAGFAGNLAILQAYTPVSGQPAGFTPPLVGYEGAIEIVVPGGVGTDGGIYPIDFRAQLCHDLYYDPAIYDAETEFLRSVQQNGLQFMNTLAQSMILFEGFYFWSYTIFGGQPWGRGDGSDGKAVNLFVQTTGVGQHHNNVSVKMQAWRDWADKANPAPPTPRRVGRYFPGLFKPAGRG